MSFSREGDESLLKGPIKNVFINRVNLEYSRKKCVALMAKADLKIEMCQ